MILNQKSLVKGKVSGLIFRFLVDAVHDQTIQASDLIKLIQQSKIQDSKGTEEEEIKVQKDHQQHCHHSLSVAAANAITILNASGYDFSCMDLSQVRIPNANLSNGVFNETNFTGAELEGVYFSGSSLNDTIFVRARMNGVSIGVTPSQSLDKEAHVLLILLIGIAW